MRRETEVVIAGAGFAGLACATALARRGVSVTVLERKKFPGAGVHTTGLLVKEAAGLLFPPGTEAPAGLTRRITNVRLHAPGGAQLRLSSPDYFFLATDTPALLRLLSDRAQRAGAEVRYGQGYVEAESRDDGFRLPLNGLRCRYLIGADGARSRVARDFGLGLNRRFLTGVEAELEGAADAPSEFHCFFGRALAPGYLGWIVPGVGVTQAGLAVAGAARPDLAKFLRHAGSHEGFPAGSLNGRRILGHRGGLIPAGGPVSPLARGNAMLVGDAAGMVSPLTGGGIHTALHYGFLLGDALADHLRRGGPHPSRALAAACPSFRFKRLQRDIWENYVPDALLDATFGNILFRKLAETIFFRVSRLGGTVELPPEAGALHENCTKFPA